MPNEPLTQVLPIDEWVYWFKDHLLSSKIEHETVRAFLFHLVDLGILAKSGKDLWKISSLDPEIDMGLSELKRRMMDLSQTREGFAIVFFLSRPEGAPSPSWNFESLFAADGGGTIVNENRSAKPEKSSDLSNLQIVKKIGRQLQPFLEMENRALSRLQGPNTSKEDAQKIYNHIFSQIREKAKPRQWEQISRKRHK